MRPTDLIRLALNAVLSHRLRSALTILGIAVGIALVTLLSSIGEGTRLSIVRQFTQFGTNIVAINPGKTKTWGVPGFLGGTSRPLTLEDAEAVRRVPGVRAVVPLCVGTAEVEFGERGRHVYVDGVTSEVPAVWGMTAREGAFLSPGHPENAPPECVLGWKLKNELFAGEPAIGQWVRVGGTKFRVVGILEPKGKFLSFDLDDTAYIPVIHAMRIFNRRDLWEIDLSVARADAVDAVCASILRLLKDRHQGEDDVTITTQTEMLSVIDRVMTIVTASVTGIAAISILVGAIGILTILVISVRERRREIGLAKALGARRRQILAQFLAEGAILSLPGGLLGLFLGSAGAAVIEWFFPALPSHTPLGTVALGIGVSLAVGVLAGAWPAWQAARLDPVEALRAE